MEESLRLLIFYQNSEKPLKTIGFLGGEHGIFATGKIFFGIELISLSNALYNQIGIFLLDFQLRREAFLLAHLIFPKLGDPF